MPRHFINKRSLAVVLISASFLLASSHALAGLPRPGMTIDKHTAIVITDPQIDFLSKKGVTWGLVGKSVVANGTVANLGTLMKLAGDRDIPLFVSPHYYYPHDHKWQFEGALEAAMHGMGMFDRKDQLSLKGFRGSGADFMPQYRKHIHNGKTVVTSPHKVYGPETNDLVLQLRKRGINRVVLAGMSANLCVESHMRELTEQGFQVVVVTDATAAAQLPELDAYEAALVNFRFIASDVWTTDVAVQKLSAVFTK
jgi:nicotinamidase-related amidase